MNSGLLFQSSENAKNVQVNVKNVQKQCDRTKNVLFGTQL